MNRKLSAGRGTTMADSASPLVQRRRLSTELRNAREERKLTQQEVADAMAWSLSKMIRVENAETSISVNDLKVLLDYYGIKDKEKTAELIALARAARKRGWWRGQSYSKVAPKELLKLIDYESAASSIQQFETMYVPGILQTRDYARAALQNFYADKPAEEMADLRTRREGQLTSEDAPQFTFLLDEPVIQRLAGGSSVMRQQLQRLIDVAKQPNVTIRVVPFSAGLHPGSGPFEIIQFADAADEYAVFIETARGDFFADKPKDVQQYREAFDRIMQKSLGREDSVARIEEVAKAIA
jgi:transcriptional regulator with XRE-family HTH domain